MDKTTFFTSAIHINYFIWRLLQIKLINVCESRLCRANDIDLKNQCYWLKLTLTYGSDYTS
jgi:hypothetical protein